MNRLLRLLILTAICLLVVRAASADPVRITSGSMNSGDCVIGFSSAP